MYSVSVFRSVGNGSMNGYTSVLVTHACVVLSGLASCSIVCCLVSSMPSLVRSNTRQMNGRCREISRSNIESRTNIVESREVCFHLGRHLTGNRGEGTIDIDFQTIDKFVFEPDRSRYHVCSVPFFCECNSVWFEGHFS